MIADKPPVLNTEEPPPKRRRKKRREGRRGDKCLNCHTPTDARYCPECGQENVAVNISLWEIFREAVEEFIRFDSKLIRTLIPLVMRPGKLTREWASGRRTRYLSPLKLYLTITALFFLVLPYAESTLIDAKAPASDVARVSISRNTTQARRGPSDKDLEGAPPAIRYVVRQLSKLDGDVDAATLFNQFTDRAPTALFFMLPVFAGVLKLLYARRKKYYVEHLVFALHIHAYYFLLLTVTTLIAALSHSSDLGTVDLLAAIAMPIYSVVALKRTYAQGWGKTLFKSAVLGFAYLVLMSITLFGCIIAAAAALPDPPSAPAPAAKTTKGTPTVHGRP